MAPADPAARHLEKRIAAVKKRHALWETQPVAQFNDSSAELVCSGRKPLAAAPEPRHAASACQA